MSADWVQVEASGTAEGVEGVPDAATAIDCWHLNKAEGITIFEADGEYWVQYSITGRTADIKQRSSEDAAYAQAEEFKDGA